MADASPFESTTAITEPRRASSEDEIRAAVYGRTSPNNNPNTYSIEEQIRSSWERCQSLGWTVTHIFRDVDESGKTTDRPMFQKMMQLVETGNVDVVVFWKLDRFSRTLMHAVELEEKLREHDVALHSVTESLDTTTVAGRFNFRTIASAAEFEREMIHQRTSMGRRAAAKEYKWLNDHPPLGYDLTDENRLTLNPQEAELVKRIFHRYLELKSMPKLATELNEEGISTKAGNEWTARAIGDVLKNEIYRGKYSFAGVEEQIPEYQIIEDSVFEEVTSVRHRFKRDGEANRKKMDQNRKSDRVYRIRDSYIDYLQQSTDIE